MKQILEGKKYKRRREGASETDRQTDRQTKRTLNVLFIKHWAHFTGGLYISGSLESKPFFYTHKYVHTCMHTNKHTYSNKLYGII